jgi:hypothetical protein
MDIDWSKAPPHATHWCPGNAKIEAGWIYNPGGNGGEFYSCYADKGLEHIPEFPEWRKSRLVPRPSKASWTGEGRPPVGTLCEAEIYDGKGMLVWREARVIHHHPRHEGSAAIAHGDEELLAWTSSFRPIRTPEQIATEEREAAIKEMLSVCPYPGSHDGVARLYAEALYDANYRKQVAP